MVDRTLVAMAGIDFNLRLDVAFGGSQTFRAAAREFSKAGVSRPAIRRWTLDE